MSPRESTWRALPELLSDGMPALCGRWLRERFDAPAIADPLWRRALAACPLARRLKPAAQQRLRRLCARFVASKRFHAMAGAALDDYWCLLIAMQACLPALQQGWNSLRGWGDVMIYPGEFRVRGNGHENFAESACEVSRQDPLVLSLADVQLDLEQPWEGYNAVIHEIAHKLDLLDGPADGVPPLTKIPRARWIEQFELAWQRLLKRPDLLNQQPSNHCASKSRSEYFAVVSELHYSHPAALRESEPAIASLLDDFYGASPASDSEAATSHQS